MPGRLSALVASAPLAAAILLVAGASSGQEELETAPALEAAPEVMHGPPYSLPWQLRPAAAATVVRSDTTWAHYQDRKHNGGFAVVSILAASVKVPGSGERWQGLAPVLRVAVVGDSPPGRRGGFAVVNPLLGATYATSFGSGMRGAFFLGATAPVGMGGGDAPDRQALEARSAGAAARSMMDSTLFAVNDFAVTPGFDFAWTADGLTLQAEATAIQLWRVSGARAQAEATKSALTSGFHAGCAITPLISIGLDVRYQRWLNPPLAVERDRTGASIEHWSVALGPRFHVPLGAGIEAHPGIAYARYLDVPNAAVPRDYQMVQLDIPVAF